MALSGDDGVTKDASRALLARCTVDVGPRVSACSLSLLASDPEVQCFQRSSLRSYPISDSSSSLWRSLDHRLSVDEHLLLGMVVEPYGYMAIELALSQERMYHVNMAPMQLSSREKLIEDC